MFLYVWLVGAGHFGTAAYHAYGLCILSTSGCAKSVNLNSTEFQNYIDVCVTVCIIIHMYTRDYARVFL